MDLWDECEDDIRNNIIDEKEQEMEKSKNLLLAKKYMVESIYRSANIEGIGITFPETQVICDGMSVSGYSIDEINAVNDLKKAWQWVFEHIDNAIDIDTLCQINRIAGKYTVINAGSFRDRYDEPIRVPVHNGNCYYPTLPDKEIIEQDLSKITKDKTLDSALNLFCYICKQQIFNDGNKRTATIFANMFMIQNGLGILSIPVDKKLKFYENLAFFYEDDKNKSMLTDFLKAYCLTGNHSNERKF